VTAGATVNVVVSCSIRNRGINRTAADRQAGGQNFALAWFWEWDDTTNDMLYRIIRNTIICPDGPVIGGRPTGGREWDEDGERMGTRK